MSSETPASECIPVTWCPHQLTKLYGLTEKELRKMCTLKESKSKPGQISMRSENDMLIAAINAAAANKKLRLLTGKVPALTALFYVRGTEDSPVEPTITNTNRIGGTLSKLLFKTPSKFYWPALSITFPKEVTKMLFPKPTDRMKAVYEKVTSCHSLEFFIESLLLKRSQKPLFCFRVPYNTGKCKCCFHFLSSLPTVCG